MNSQRVLNIGLLVSLIIFSVVIIFTIMSWGAYAECMLERCASMDGVKECSHCSGYNEIHQKWAGILGSGFTAIIAFLLSTHLYQFYLTSKKSN